MKKYTSICVTRSTRELIGKRAALERRLLGEIVALARGIPIMSHFFIGYPAGCDGAVRA